MPWISQQSYAHPSITGQLVRLGWLAFNAASCAVQLGGTVIINGAPTDTYREGSVVPLNAAPGTYNLTVIANAAVGKAQATWPLPPVTIGAPVTIPTGATPRGIAFTPDSKLAFIANAGSNTVTVVNLTSRTAEPTAIAVGSGPSGVAITSDGALALVANTGSNDVSVIDIASTAAEPTRKQDQPEPSRGQNHRGSVSIALHIPTLRAATAEGGADGGRRVRVDEFDVRCSGCHAARRSKKKGIRV